MLTYMVCRLLSLVVRQGWSIHKGISSNPYTSASVRKAQRSPSCRAMASAAGGDLAAVGQMCSTSDQQQNFATCRGLAADARAQGCSILFLPEAFSFIGSGPLDAVAKGQPLDGPLMQQYQTLARETGIWLSLGGFQVCA